MKPGYFLLFSICFASFISSCSNDLSKKQNVFLITSYREARTNTDFHTKEACMELMGKVEDPVTHEKAMIWNDRATALKVLFDSAGEAVKNVLQTENQSRKKLPEIIDDLHEKLKKVDSGIYLQFSEKILSMKRSFDSIEILKINRDLATEKCLCDISVLENNLVMYCTYQIGQTDGAGFFTKSGILVGQNSNHLRKGDQLIISAGVGSFDTRAAAEIIIGGKKVKVTDAMGEYRQIIYDQPGKYKKHVEVLYTDVNGERITHEADVDYTVDPE